MNEQELDSTLEETRAIATEAAALVLSGFRKPIDIQKKGEIDLLTEYDLKSEALIRERLTKSFPGTTIVGEEGEKNDSADLVWHVDPIDGTTNYAHGHPYFAVSIALCEKTRPILGVVVAPALQLTWTGIRGRGAFRNGARCKVEHDRRPAAGALLDGLPVQSPRHRGRQPQGMERVHQAHGRDPALRRGGDQSLLRR